MPKNKPNILSTAILESKFARMLESAGISCEMIPFIRVAFRKDEETGRRVGELMHEKITAIFTSKHAVEAIREIPGITKAPWKIYCLGSSTSKLVSEVFSSATIAGTAENAASLAHLILEKGPASSIDFFCGDIRREELPSILNQRSIALREWIVYETLTTPVRIEKEYLAILFLSPSAVRSFFSVNKPSTSTLFFAIGNTTAIEIRKLTENRILISKQASIRSLVDKVIEEIQSVETGDA